MILWKTYLFNMVIVNKNTDKSLRLLNNLKKLCKNNPNKAVKLIKNLRKRLIARHIHIYGDLAEFILKQEDNRFIGLYSYLTDFSSISELTLCMQNSIAWGNKVECDYFVKKVYLIMGAEYTVKHIMSDIPLSIRHLRLAANIDLQKTVVQCNILGIQKKFKTYGEFLEYMKKLVDKSKYRYTPSSSPKIYGSNHRWENTK